MTTVFLTGSTGHLGYHIALELLSEKYKIIALTRQPPDERKRVKGIEYVMGNLFDRASYRKALITSDVVIHSAAAVSFSGDPEFFRKTNFEATRALLSEAQKGNISRFIFVSSRGTHGTSSPGETTDEASAFQPESVLDAYLVSKQLAEKEVLETARIGEMECMVISPTAMFGGLDTKPGPVGALIKGFIQGRAKVYLDGGINVVDVKDVAKATVAAIKKGSQGNLYFLGGTNISMKQLYDRLGMLVGKPSPKIKIPFIVAYLSAYLFVFLENVTGRPVPATPRKVVSFKKRATYCSSTKAQEAFGLHATPIDKTLVEAILFFQS